MSKALALATFLVMTIVAAQAAGGRPEGARAPRGDRNTANRMLMQMSEDDRRNAFAVVLIKGGERCTEVTRTFYQGSARPSWNAIWNVQCSGGPAYVVQIMSDEAGSTKALTCGELRAAGGGECFTVLPQ